MLNVSLRTPGMSLTLRRRSEEMVGGGQSQTKNKTAVRIKKTIMFQTCWCFHFGLIYRVYQWLSRFVANKHLNEHIGEVDGLVHAKYDLAVLFVAIC